MNKLYATSLALTLFAGVATAQSPGGSHSLAIKQQPLLRLSHHNQPPPANREVIWSDDFSTPSNWTFGNLAGAIGSWVIGTTPPGGPPFDIPPIASTTASNGFALYDSNVLNLNNDNAWMATANPINLSDHSHVVLNFEQYTAALNGHYYVETSSDNSTWASTEINLNVAPNTTTANPDYISLDISGQVGGAATAWIRFRYQSSTADYAWMVDDISIVTLPEHEIVMDYGYSAQFGDGYEYGRIPASQMPSSVNVGASVINFGLEDQTNVIVNVSIQDESGTEVGTVSSSIPVMTNGDTVVTDETITLSTWPIGTYTAYFTLTSDQIDLDENPGNNSKARYFSVTPDLYSLDGIDVLPDSILTLGVVGTGSFSDNTQDVRLLNYFEVTQEETFHGVEVYMSSETAPGSYFIAAVYDTADVFGTPSNLTAPLVESTPRVITEADMVGQRASVSFTDPITLSPGAYFVSANLYQEGGNDIYILDDVTVPQPNIASMLWLPIDDNDNHLYGGNGTAWAVRLSSALNVGVQETPGLKGVSMYPSPTFGPLEVRVESPANMSAEVFNALGAKVLTSSFTGTTTTLDLAGNAAGIYTVRISDGTNFNMQRIVLK